MSLLPYRTTPELVEGIVDVQAGFDVTPFIAFANQMTTDICTYPTNPYSDGYVGSKMELIERWLSAHLYTIFDNQLSRAKAGTVAVGYQYKTDLNLYASMYGQQVMILDTNGGLAKQSNAILIERKVTVGGFWTGIRRCWPGQNDFPDSLITVEAVVPSITSVVRRFTNQKLLYWQKTGSDRFGKPVYAEPIVMPCRWEDKQQEVILADGRKVMSKGYLLLQSEVLVGSWVFLGGGKDPMTAWQALPTYPALPTVLQGGREVLIDNVTPDLKAQGFVFEGWF